MSWIKSHGTALAALAAALGTAAAALQIPELATTTHYVAAFGGVATIVGTIAHSYVQGAGGGGG